MDSKAELRAEVRAAQKVYETTAATARQGRREAFTRAKTQGLSLREIAEEAGLHTSRIGQIIEGK